jgi:adenylyltransferase/sulfurtransferase
VPNCAEGGVLGVLAGVIGSLQATEAIKLLLGRGESLIGRLLLFDALEMRFRELRLRKDPRCPVCGERPTITELLDYEEVCDVGETSRPTTPDGHLDVRALKQRQEAGDGPLLVDVRTPQEWAICRLHGATLIPLQELASRLGELDREREIVVYCHVGVRSAMAVDFLRGQGFERARNLEGGIDAWSIHVDPSTPRY